MEVDLASRLPTKLAVNSLSASQRDTAQSKFNWDQFSIPVFVPHDTKMMGGVGTRNLIQSGREKRRVAGTC
jgi:hypothetical protein